MGDSSARLLAVASASAIAGSVLTLAAIRLHRSLRRADGDEQGECGTCSSSRSELATPSSSQQKRDPFDPSPRSHYLNWDDYFMAVAFLSAQRSKDPNKQVGACIVDSRQVICGIGYNGFPRGCADELLPWAKASTSGDPLCTKYPYVCHAEMNAILNKNGASVAGARVFVTMFPCNECAKLLIQAGISEVIYHEDKDAGPGRRPDSPSKDGFRRDQQYAASRRLLALAGVKVRQHRFRRPVALHLSNNPWRPAVRTPLESEAAAADAGGGGGEPAAAALEQQGEQQRRAEPAAIDPALAAALLASSLGSGSGTRASSSLAAEEDREATSSGGCSGDEAVARVADAASTPPGTRYHTPRSFALTSPMS